MAGLWILIAAMSGAVMSETQRLQREDFYVNETQFSAALQDETSINQDNRNEENPMESHPFHNSHGLVSVGPLKSTSDWKLFTARPRPSTHPRVQDAVSKAAAQMLSFHLAQCLAVVTQTSEEKGLEALIASLDTAGVPRLLLRRGGLRAPYSTGKVPFHFSFPPESTKIKRLLVPCGFGILGYIKALSFTPCNVVSLQSEQYSIV